MSSISARADLPHAPHRRFSEPRVAARTREGMPIDILFDFVFVHVNGPRAADAGIRINLDFTDSDVEHLDRERSTQRATGILDRCGSHHFRCQGRGSVASMPIRIESAHSPSHRSVWRARPSTRKPIFS